MNLLKSQSIGYSLFSSSSELKTRNEAQRCIYATWPSTDMTFANPTELFQLLSSRLDWTKPQQQRELLLLGLRIVEPLFSKCRIFSRCIPPWCLVEHVPRHAVNILNLIWVFYEAQCFFGSFCLFGLLLPLLLCKHPAETPNAFFVPHTNQKKTDEPWCIFLQKKKFVVLAFDSNVTSDDVKNDGFLKTSDHQ